VNSSQATGQLQNYEWQAYLIARGSVTNSLTEPTKTQPRHIYYYPWLNGRDVEIIGYSDDFIEGYVTIS